MRTLRALVDRDSLAAGIACAWSLADEAGQPVESGTGTPAQWPRAGRAEVFLDVDVVRVVRLQLPPLPAARLRDAARFALEDQSLDGLDSAEIAVSAQDAEGGIRAAIADRASVDRLRDALASAKVRAELVAPISELATPAPGRWLWVLRPGAQRGFVVEDDGELFAVDEDLRGVARGDLAPVPTSLRIAVADAERAGRRPLAIDVRGPSYLAAAVERWGRELSVPFTPAQEWDWRTALPARGDALDFSAAPLRGAHRAGTAWPAFRAATWLVAIAAGVHVAASVGDFAAARWRERQIVSEQRALAEQLAPELLSALTPASALMRKHRDARHRAGAPADDDYLPLLARAAPALQSLPAGSLRGLAYGNGQLLTDLAPVAEDAVARFQRDLYAAGLAAVAAPTASGMRVRVTSE